MSFQALFDFESALADYTGAPYVVVTDSCTHAMELCLRHDRPQMLAFTAFTYLSVPMLMHHLKINYVLTSEEWTGEYQLHGTRIWDSARRLEHNMYRPGQLQCLSFGWTKPLYLGRVGAVLLDDETTYHTLSAWRSDGRNLRLTPWQTQQTFGLGWHYCPSLELCERGLEALPKVQPQSQKVDYPDCRKITIVP
jgi:dTDP-4-amino-4,6-dideoxygalactose transaminase